MTRWTIIPDTGFPDEPMSDHLTRWAALERVVEMFAGGCNGQVILAHQTADRNPGNPLEWFSREVGDPRLIYEKIVDGEVVADYFDLASIEGEYEVPKEEKVHFYRRGWWACNVNGARLALDERLSR